MHSSEDDPEKDTITSDAESLIKLNPFTTDMRDHMIKHAIEIKFVKNKTRPCRKGQRSQNEFV